MCFMYFKRFLSFLDKPDVRSSPPSPYRVREGQTATLACTVTAANPNTGITWRWFKTDSPNNVLHNGPSYILPNIQRGRSGSYSCTASNSVGTSEAATVNVSVQCKWFHAQLWISWMIYVEHNMSTCKVCLILGINKTQQKCLISIIIA